MKKAILLLSMLVSALFSFTAFAVTFQCPQSSEFVRNGQWVCPSGWSCTDFKGSPTPDLAFGGAGITNNFSDRVACKYGNPNNAYAYAYRYDSYSSEPVYPSNWTRPDIYSWLTKPGVSINQAAWQPVSRK